METQCLGDEQRQKSDSLEQTLLVVFVIEEAIPVYLGQNAWLEKYLVMVGFDDVQAVSYSSQAEASIADTIENTGEATLVIRKKYWGSDEVITFVAPIIKFVTKHPSICLTDKHVFVVLEAQVEVFRKAKIAVVSRRVKIPFVKEFCSQHVLLARYNLFVFVKQTASVSDKHTVVLAQDAERLSNRYSLRIGECILIYRYDYNAAHLSLIMRMSPADSL